VTAFIRRLLIVSVCAVAISSWHSGCSSKEERTPDPEALKQELQKLKESRQKEWKKPTDDSP
jgi:hypothetical protein